MIKWTCAICHENMYSANDLKGQEYVRCLTCGQFFKNPYFDEKVSKAEPTLEISWLEFGIKRTKLSQGITKKEAVELIREAINEHHKVVIIWDVCGAV